MYSGFKKFQIIRITIRWTNKRLISDYIVSEGKFVNRNVVNCNKNWRGRNSKHEINFLHISSPLKGWGVIRYIIFESDIGAIVVIIQNICVCVCWMFLIVVSLADDPFLKLDTPNYSHQLEFDSPNNRGGHEVYKGNDLVKITWKLQGRGKRKNPSQTFGWDGRSRNWTEPDSAMSLGFQISCRKLKLWCRFLFFILETHICCSN